MTDALVPIGTGLSLPDDIMADLLKAQASSITTNQQLPDIGVLGAGVGLYEFSDQPGKTAATFRGVVLNNHERNILWDTPAGTSPANGEKPKPACSSNNGIIGIVREGFAHKGLPEGEVGDAEGTKTVACATCPYNKFGTGNWFKPQASARGKAVTNQRAVYILIEGIAVPYRLVLSPSSLATFDEYLMGLVARKIPVQTVITEFSQSVESKNGQRYGVARFSAVAGLTQEQFNGVMEMRKQWDKSIMPTPVAAPIPATASVAEDNPAAATMDAMAGKGETIEDAQVEDDFPEALKDKGDSDLPF